MTLQWIAPSKKRFEHYVAHSEASYAKDLQLAYRQSSTEALAQASGTVHELLPDGVHTPDHHLFTLLSSDGEDVGILWFGVHAQEDINTLFIYDLEIYPHAQRRGHARQALKMVEDWAATADIRRISLNVFAHNPAAQALYRSCGLVACEITMSKPLG